MKTPRGILILDFGSQLTQLIARRLREMGHYCEIKPFHFAQDEILKLNPYGLILSGGPHSVYEAGSPQRDDLEKLIEMFPTLGICYGMQLLAKSLGGKVQSAQNREYGFNRVQWSQPLPGVKPSQKVWMSHGDLVAELPQGFELVAESESLHPAAMRKGKQVLAVQFHPEVAHTEGGSQIFKYFCEEMAKAPINWDAHEFKKSLVDDILNKVAPEEHVLVGLSGGVDSTVVATLLTQTLGRERVHCVFVNNGLLRAGEFEKVVNDYNGLGLNLKAVDASEKFLSALRGITDPEQKRKIIGKIFIEVFEHSLEDRSQIQWLAQGTLYPDVIESVSPNGSSVTIKSHHNVGGLPEKMKLKLLEPVRDLFKDEVRKLGEELGLSRDLVWRHPFPGPGLAIRILGDVTEEKLNTLRKADQVYIDFLKEKNLYHKIWQAFTVLLPIHTVGVMGDGRTYEKVIAIRAVTSSDGMTADWYPFTFDELREVSNRLTNQVSGINRVVYDVTSKPPGTIEWE